MVHHINSSPVFIQVGRNRSRRPALGTPAASLESLDLNRPEVQSYVAELLLDPGFDKFVGELGDYYDRLKKKLPSEAGGGATPFVPGRSGGTASKRTDPMDDD